MDPLASIAELFTISKEDFKAIVQGFKQEYEQGLSTSCAIGLTTMIPSFVTKLPTGNETGTYLSLDLGGSNLRVSAVHLMGNGNVQVEDVRRSISDALRTSSIPEFFDWIADTVAELCSVVTSNMETPLATPDQPMRMGVCWSFPLNQTDIAAGTILRMGKGFTLSGIEGQDLTSLLHQAFTQKGLNIIVTALINDAVGTLVAHAYTNPRACAGFIHGTGVNAAYPEKIDRITKLPKKNDALKDQEFMLVNTEIDIFGSDASYLPQNKYDLALDKSHSQPGFQGYEKMMSGAYLGELVRLVALDIITEHGTLFQGNMPKQLADPWAFTTVAMSDIESENSDKERQSKASEWFEFENGYTPSEQDMKCFVSICRIVSSRASSLAAAAIASIIEQQQLHKNYQNEPIVVGVNGSTFEKYPNMPERILKALQEWFGPITGSRIQLELASDGGSIGGALVAMLYHDHAPASTSHVADIASNTAEKDMERKSATCLEPLAHAARKITTSVKRWIQKKRRCHTSSSTISKQHTEKRTQG